MVKLIAFISVVVVVLAFCDAAPLQELPPKKDHVPVYIRVGDTPLAEINPGLARAFNEDKIKESKPVEEQEPEENVEIAKEPEEAEKSQDEEESPQAEEENVEDEAETSESQPKAAAENAENDEKSESPDDTKDVPKEE